MACFAGLVEWQQDLSTPVFSHLRAGVQASLLKDGAAIDGLEPSGRTGAHPLRFTGCTGAKARRWAMPR